MSLIQRKLILTGGRKGMTGMVDRQFRAVNGVITLQGSSPDVEALTLFLGRMYQAFPEGSVELEAANGERNLQTPPETGSDNALLSQVQPSGQGAAEKTVPGGAGHAEPTTGEAGVLPKGDGHEDSRVSRLREALAQLNTLDDGHWTSAGLPAVEAVSAILGEPVTRAEIASVAPDLNRKGE